MNFDVEAQRSLERLIPRLGVLPGEFEIRLRTYFPTLFRLLHELYGTHYDFFYHLEQVLQVAAAYYRERTEDLRRLDALREQEPHWFESQRMLGAVCYVDLFAGTLQGMRKRISYLEELGINYLHLMPLFLCPEGENDGGYAVSSFRDVNPAVGTLDDLRALADDLRAKHISLVLDFVFNHTSDEHIWAQRALAGDRNYQDFYLMFNDRTLPDQYELTLREIFPEQSPGNFTYRPEIGKWVWTTFHNYQWDLNYANPALFTAMLAEMLFIANMGVEVLRLDAIAFIWKELGTSCESLPQVHLIIQAYNILSRIVAPALIFKSEAIVHPDDVASYIRTEESPLSYNPTLMALGWEALATRDVSLLRLSMERHFRQAPGCTWINYVRCHDDIGWTFADEDAAVLGINGFFHRQFLNAFYTGRFPGSFARGLPFNFNPRTLDMRISGMCASLAGLEDELPQSRADALKRIVLLHSVAFSAGGIPLIYLGDELAMPNDYSYAKDPAKKDDSRWVHRVVFDEARAAQRHHPDTEAGYVFTHLLRLIRLRQMLPQMANGGTVFFDTGNPSVLGFYRHETLCCLANFSERRQTIHLLKGAHDLIGERDVQMGTLTLEPYQVAWLVQQEDV